MTGTVGSTLDRDYDCRYTIVEHHFLPAIQKGVKNGRQQTTTTNR